MDPDGAGPPGVDAAGAGRTVRHQLPGGERRHGGMQPEAGEHPKNQGGSRAPRGKGCGVRWKEPHPADAARKKPGPELGVTDQAP